MTVEIKKILASAEMTKYDNFSNYITNCHIKRNPTNTCEMTMPVWNGGPGTESEATTG